MKEKNLPRPGDYIDIHTHDARPSEGVFIVENLMAHEGKIPEETQGMAYSVGIHPWYLNEKNHDDLISVVQLTAGNENVIAVGEAGFDKLRGPSIELQRKTFEEQVIISEDLRKPLVIHCVRMWDELILAHKKLKPVMPWLVHGFRAKKELAFQLISRGMYLSFWFEFVLRGESACLLKELPPDRIFIETDGAEVSIKDIYAKVSGDLGINIEKLKTIMADNFQRFFMSV